MENERVQDRGESITIHNLHALWIVSDTNDSCPGYIEISQLTERWSTLKFCNPDCKDATGKKLDRVFRQPAISPLLTERNLSSTNYSARQAIYRRFNQFSPVGGRCTKTISHRRRAPEGSINPSSDDKMILHKIQPRFREGSDPRVTRCVQLRSNRSWSFITACLARVRRDNEANRGNCTSSNY